MTERVLRLPTSADWLQLGVRVGSELHAGKQSRVFTATVDGRQVALKLTDGRLTDRTLLAERMRVAETLADDIAAAVAPARIHGELVLSVGDWLVTATPFIDGDQVDITTTPEAHLMGRTLAALHDALARLPVFSVPPVAPLRLNQNDTDRSGWQLLHGDFSDQNIVATSDGLRVFDFDDCGYGPAAYDLANSLYMVLFDAEVSGRSDRYEAFRPAFLEGYADAIGTAPDIGVVDSLIGTRIETLGHWLDDLDNAPIGIRTSSPEWRETLAAFVASHSPHDPSRTG